MKDDSNKNDDPVDPEVHGEKTFNKPTVKPKPPKNHPASSEFHGSVLNGQFIVLMFDGTQAIITTLTNLPGEEAAMAPINVDLRKYEGKTIIVQGRLDSSRRTIYSAKVVNVLE
jgi:hypothetical protein